MAAPSPPNEAYEALLAELESELKAVQVLYEQYFLGMERAIPAKRHAALKLGIQALKREPVRNTGIKFRLASLWQRFLSYERMWQRTITEMEEGRYRRDLFKARLRGRGSAADTAKKVEKPAEAAAAAPTPAPPRTNGTPAASEGLSDAKVQKLFEALVTAKRRCREDTTGLTLEAMRRSLTKQIPAIKAKHGAAAVDFKVVIKDGRAVLKAVPR